MWVSIYIKPPINLKDNNYRIGGEIYMLKQINNYTIENLKN